MNEAMIVDLFTLKPMRFYIKYGIGIQTQTQIKNKFVELISDDIIELLQE